MHYLSLSLSLSLSQTPEHYLQKSICRIFNPCCNLREKFENSTQAHNKILLRVIYTKQIVT